MDETCRAMVPGLGGWSSERCTNKSRVEYEGKRYCGIHNPGRQKRKEAVVSERACTRPCPTCSGTGRIYVDVESTDGQPRQRQQMCECGGTGIKPPSVLSEEQELILFLKSYLERYQEGNRVLIIDESEVLFFFPGHSLYQSFLRFSRSWRQRREENNKEVKE